MNNDVYVHGYSECESSRLHDQASTLTEILHHDTIYPDGCKVLEAGCGVGAQTVILAGNSPGARITSIDISPDSVSRTKKLMEKEGITSVSLEVGDIFDLKFDDESFDHVFVCFVLEHLPDPVAAISCLRRVLKKGGTMTIIEGDHGSCFFHPHSEDAMKAIRCLIDVQRNMNGNSLIGRELYPLLKKAGFDDVKVSPRMVYVDSDRPSLVEGFTKNTFTAMVEGVREKALEMGLIDEDTWEKGIKDLYRTAEDDGTFCYTFFKSVAVK